MADLFAVAAPGLESITGQELYQLGLMAGGEASPDVQLQSGGAAFKGEQRELYLANLWLRSASRVLVRLGEFHAASFPELRKKAARLPWENYLAAGQPVTLRVTCHKSRLYHSDAVAERLAGAIEDRLGQPTLVHRPVEEDSPEHSPQLVIARLVNDQCALSIDSSGALLHRRGYRLAVAKAPLRETLAAGMLLACGWDCGSPLLDPFCGSGTLAIEAALLARRFAPGRARRFAFMDWPEFDALLWKNLLAEAEAQITSFAPPIYASDRDAGAIQMAQANAERARVEADIQFSCRAVSAISPPAVPGWVVTNPPYGLRISTSKDLRDLYARLGDILRVRCPGWQAGILCNDLKLLGQTRLDLDTSFSLVNGGVRVYLARGRIRS